MQAVALLSYLAVSFANPTMLGLGLLILWSSYLLFGQDPTPVQEPAHHERADR